jgi:hypothetical protein
MKQKFFLIISILALVFFIVPKASAQWVQVGLTGQVVQALAMSGTNTSSPSLYAGCYGNGGGVYVSTDSGSSWSDVGIPPPSSFALVYALAVVGANTSSPLLFAGVGGGTNFDPAGVYLSTNEGLTWTAANNGLTDSNANVLALEAIGSDVFAGTTDSGVYLSTNNGTSWTAVNNGFSAAWQGGFVLPYIEAFTAETGSSSSMLFAGTLFGVYRTTNNGTSWEHTSTGFPDTNINTFALAVSGSNLLAGTYADGVFLSTNNGTSWTSANSGLASIGKSTIYSFATSGSNVFAASDSGIFLSTNNGASWNSLDTALNSATSSPVYGVLITSLIVVDSNLYAGTDVGVWKRPLSDFGISAVSPASLTQNSLVTFPNPFSSSTTINFTTSESGIANVSVVNVLGTEVARIFSGELSAGEHSFMWGNPTGLPDGMYECIVQINGSVDDRSSIVERVPIVVAR